MKDIFKEKNVPILFFIILGSLLFFYLSQRIEKFYYLGGLLSFTYALYGLSWILFNSEVNKTQEKKFIFRLTSVVYLFVFIVFIALLISPSNFMVPLLRIQIFYV